MVIKMYRSIITGALQGISASIIRTEVDISNGLPGFSMVGYLGSEVREAKERVQVALKNTGFNIPPKKITVNLSPANFRKEGTAFDVPIAIGVLGAMEYFKEDVAEQIFFAGELGLNGEIKPIKGVLPMVRAAAKMGIKCCILPKENVAEGSVIRDIIVRGAENLKDLVLFLQEENLAYQDKILPIEQFDVDCDEFCINYSDYPDFSEVGGQETAKRAAEIAAAGFHNFLMCGPPGAGKSMIAKRVAGIMPPLSWSECLEVSSIYSIIGKLNSENPLIQKRPYINPHHSISHAALVGGGFIPHPGAISLSHKGILFLDELTEFQFSTLDLLRQPLEEHTIQINRMQGNYEYPADFLLVCAMNPCKCGYYPDKNRCKCTDWEVKKYLNRISGPLMDRLDMVVETNRIDIKSLQGERKEESSEEIRQRVEFARKTQKKRFQNSRYQFNSQIEAKDIDKYCKLEEKQRNMMELAYQNLQLSVRGYHRILRVARTIADLEGKEQILEEHIGEAICYRTQMSWMGE